MPAYFVPYLVGLVQGVFVSATSFERQFGCSHDGITRSLVKRFSWERWIIGVIQRLFGILSGGYLILDDTVIAKPYARHMQGAGFVHSSVLNKTVYGYNVVFLCWSNGTLTIPLAWKWYKANSKTKIDLALELLATAKHRRKMTPRYVLFDKFYGADRVLNTLHAYRWKFVAQLKCNRIINAAPIREDLTDNGDTTVGWVTDQVNVLIIKYDEKYFFTNDLSLPMDDLPTIYKNRWPIEEVFRFLKTELRLPDLWQLVRESNCLQYQLHFL